MFVSLHERRNLMKIKIYIKDWDKTKRVSCTTRRCKGLMRRQSLGNFFCKVCKRIRSSNHLRKEYEKIIQDKADEFIKKIEK